MVGISLHLLGLASKQARCRVTLFWYNTGYACEILICAYYHTLESVCVCVCVCDCIQMGVIYFMHIHNM